MTLKGAAAVVGVAELTPMRERADRDSRSLLAEVWMAAIRDAGLTKQDIDRLMMQAPGEEDGELLSDPTPAVDSLAVSTRQAAKL